MEDLTNTIQEQTTLADAIPVEKKADPLEIKIVKKQVDNSHYYFVNEEFFPGVTSILDEAAPTPYALRQFMLKNDAETAEDIKNRAAGLGSKLHDAFERLLNGVELNLLNDYQTTKEKKHLVSFYQWFNSYKPKNIQTEFTLASLKYKYAGTMDLACTLDGKLTIIDFKTGNGIHWNHGLQLAAYRQAFEEMTGQKVEQVFILRTGTTHKIGYEFKEITVPFDNFLNVYQTYLNLHGGKIPEPPLIDVYPQKMRLNFDFEREVYETV